MGNTITTSIYNQSVSFPSWRYLYRTTSADRQQLEVIERDEEVATILNLSRTFQDSKNAKLLTATFDEKPCIVALNYSSASNDTIEVALCFAEENLTIPVHFTTPLKGTIVSAAVSHSSFNMVYNNKYGAMKAKQTLALIVCTGDSTQLVLLNMDIGGSAYAHHIDTLKYDTSIPSSAFVTAIHILEADKTATRISHSDPRILLGFSTGHLLMYRLRTKVYTYGAPRTRKPVNLSEFVQFPDQPIDHITCTRTSNNLRLLIAISQNGQCHEANHNELPYIRLIEVFADVSKESLGAIFPISPAQSDNTPQLMTTTTESQIVSVRFTPTPIMPNSTATHLFILSTNPSYYFLDVWNVQFFDNSKVKNSNSAAPLEQLTRLYIAKNQCYQSIQMTLEKYSNNTLSAASSIPIQDVQHIIQTNDDSLLYDTIIQYYNASIDEQKAMMKDFKCAIRFDKPTEQSKRSASESTESTRPRKRSRIAGSFSPSSITSDVPIEDAALLPIVTTRLSSPLPEQPAQQKDNVAQNEMEDIKDAEMEESSCDFGELMEEDVDIEYNELSYTEDNSGPMEEEPAAVDYFDTFDSMSMDLQNDENYTIQTEQEQDEEHMQIDEHTIISLPTDVEVEEEQNSKATEYEDNEASTEQYTPPKTHLSDRTNVLYTDQGLDAQFAGLDDLNTENISQDSAVEQERPVTVELLDDTSDSDLDEFCDAQSEWPIDSDASDVNYCDPHLVDEGISNINTAASPDTPAVVDPLHEKAYNDDDCDSDADTVVLSPAPSNQFTENRNENQYDDSILDVLCSYTNGQRNSSIKEISQQELKGFGNHCWNHPSAKFKFYCLLILVNRQIKDELCTEVMYLLRHLMLAADFEWLSDKQKQYCRKLLKRLRNKVHPTVAYREILNPFSDTFIEDQLREREAYLSAL